MALDPKRRRTTWRAILFWCAFAVAYAEFRFDLASSFAPPWVRWAAAGVIAVFGVAQVWFVARHVRDGLRQRRMSQTLHDVRSGGRWPLDEPYAVEVDLWCDGGRSWHSMRIHERGVTFLPRGVFSRPIDFVGVDVVHVHASWIEIVSGDESVRVVPRSYADRERMLWELAFRWSAAVDRGIDETPPAVPNAVATPTATAADDVPHAVASGLGLASALAGPMDRGNPAPPRKSGLGNGLFVVPTDDH